jgi:hypothetical protein
MAGRGEPGRGPSCSHFATTNSPSRYAE